MLTSPLHLWLWRDHWERGGEMALQINFPALETVNFINTTFHSKGHTYLVLLKVSRYHGKYWQYKASEGVDKGAWRVSPDPAVLFAIRGDRQDRSGSPRAFRGQRNSFRAAGRHLTYFSLSQVRKITGGHSVMIRIPTRNENVVRNINNQAMDIESLLKYWVSPVGLAKHRLGNWFKF